jgi:hypothetical protein
LADAHHERDVGAVNVGIEKADAAAKAGKGDGEVDGNGGFPNASFTGTDRDQTVNARDRRLGLILLLRVHEVLE